MFEKSKTVFSIYSGTKKPPDLHAGSQAVLLCLLGILQIHPQGFIDAQVVFRDVAEELALFVDELLGGGEQPPQGMPSRWQGVYFQELNTDNKEIGLPGSPER